MASLFIGMTWSPSDEESCSPSGVESSSFSDIVSCSPPNVESCSPYKPDPRGFYTRAVNKPGGPGGITSYGMRPFCGVGVLSAGDKVVIRSQQVG